MSYDYYPQYPTLAALKANLKAAKLVTEDEEGNLQPAEGVSLDIFDEFDPDGTDAEGFPKYKKKPGVYANLRTTFEVQANISRKKSPAQPKRIWLGGMNYVY